MAGAELVQVLQQKKEILRRLKGQVEAVEREIETLTAAIKILEKSTGAPGVTVEAVEPKLEVFSEKNAEGVPHTHVTPNIRKAFP